MGLWDPSGLNGHDTFAAKTSPGGRRPEPEGKRSQKQLSTETPAFPPPPPGSPTHTTTPPTGSGGTDSPSNLGRPQPVTVQREPSFTSKSKPGRQMGQTYLLYLSGHVSLRRAMSWARPTQDQYRWGRYRLFKMTWYTGTSEVVGDFWSILGLPTRTE